MNSRLAERELDAEQRVVAQAARLGEVRAGGVQRVPRAGRLVGGEVLNRVDEVGDPAEQPARLAQRLGVAPACPRAPRCARTRRAVAISVGSVTVSSAVPGPAAASTAAWRPTASVSTPTSKPSRWPDRALAAAQRVASDGRRPAHPGRPSAPSPSSTWSRIFAAASTSDTVAASRAQSPTATSAFRIPRSAHRPAVAPLRRRPSAWASASTEITSPS